MAPQSDCPAEGASEGPLGTRPWGGGPGPRPARQIPRGLGPRAPGKPACGSRSARQGHTIHLPTSRGTTLPEGRGLSHHLGKSPALTEHPLGAARGLQAPLPLPACVSRDPPTGPRGPEFAPIIAKVLARHPLPSDPSTGRSVPTAWSHAPPRHTCRHQGLPPGAPNAARIHLLPAPTLPALSLLGRPDPLLNSSPQAHSRSGLTVQCLAGFQITNPILSVPL